MERKPTYAELEKMVKVLKAELLETNKKLETEINKRKELEKLVYESRKDWENIFHSISSPIIILDQNQV
ncbi:MAG: hypothetical protein JRI44_13540, partial [Deltaproteobacteria bacterium]|nr:hypothetical protein [Deltaproteobacteria bacterium]